jgi:D-alanine transfer protein
VSDAAATATAGPTGGHRLRAAAWAVLATAIVVAVGLQIADWLEQRAVHALAPRIVPQKYLGRSLQAEALARPDLVVVYGSSELMDVDSPFHASNLLGAHPTGVTPFIVGRAGTTPLNFLQQIVSVGPALRGKRVVISYTPGMFLRELINPDFYAGSFSPLHAYALAFDTELDHDVKRAAAVQMLRYPDTLADDPLLRFALERLATDTALDRALYGLAMPLGVTEGLALRLQDRLSALGYIVRHGPSAATMDGALPIDWPSLQAEADRAARDAATTNPFGVVDTFWEREGDNLLRARWNDDSFLEQLELANAWTDLDLTLRVLRQYGARVLILVMPLHGPYYDHMGISPEARQAYYRKLDAVGRAAGVRVVSFADHDDDPYFLADPHGHLSAKGWVNYAQAIDAFVREMP